MQNERCHHIESQINKHQQTKQKMCCFYTFFLQLGKENNDIISIKKRNSAVKREMYKYSRSHFLIEDQI